MKQIFILFCIVLMFTQSVNAFEYPTYYNRPSSNQKTINDFAEYMQNLKDKLQKNWLVPDFMEEGHIRVLFKIDKFGNVISGDIIETSGNQIYDESAVYAIHKSEPFGPFPQNTTKETITVNYVFDTTLVKTDKMKELYDLAKKYQYSDKKLALNYINSAIEEVLGDNESYFLYKRRAKIKEAMGDHIGAKSDYDQYEKMKTQVDIKRVHLLKHQAEQEDSAFAYYYLAYAYERIRDYDNAIWAINRAIERTDLNQQYKRYKKELIKNSENLY